MLLNFSLRNYRSFAGTLQFSMMRDAHDIAAETSWERPDVSTVAAVYGPNASGKSNFLSAINFVPSFLRRGDAMGDAFDEILGLEPFLLDPALAKEPTDFLVEFVAPDGVRYEYTFSLTSSEVVEEGLVAYYSRQPTRLYERSTDAAGEQVMRFGPALKGAKRQLWSVTRKNVLFLSVAGGSGKIESLTIPYLALTRGIDLLFRAGGLSSRRRGVLDVMSVEERDPAAFERLVGLVRRADLGIDDIEVRRSDGEPVGSEGLSGSGGYGRVGRAEVVFLHRAPGGRVGLAPEQESEGTLSALSFFSHALDVLERGATLLVDELDMSLHPTLVREFVALFTSPDTNPMQAQLIFSTHDVSLITVSSDEGRVLFRDQVWFCEKDGAGRTELIPATSYSPRKGENLGRNYLNGIYGALPRVAIHEEVIDMMGRGLEGSDE